MTPLLEHKRRSDLGVIFMSEPSRTITPPVAARDRLEMTRRR